MAELTPAQHLAALDKAEAEILEIANKAFEEFLAAVLSHVVPSRGVVAAVDPAAAERAQAVWDKWVIAIMAALSVLWLARYSVGGKDDRRAQGRLGKFRAAIRERLEAVPKKVYAHVEQVVSDGIRRGDALSTIEAQLTEILDPATHGSHAARLARTTTVATYNDGAEQGWSERTGVTKTWNAILDERVRHTHATLDGKKIAIGRFFDVGGFHAQYPGDPDLPAQEALNCRCILTFEEAVVAGVTVTVDSSEADAPTAALPNGWRGPIAGLDRLTGDTRWLATPPDGIRTRQLPMTVTLNHVGDGEHVPVVGRMDRVWKNDEDGLLWAEGAFDLGSDEGREVARQAAEKFLFTMSIHPDQLTAVEHLVDAEGNLAADDVISKALETGEVPDGYNVIVVFQDWRLASVALVPIPAYDEARIEVLYDYSPTVADAPQDIAEPTSDVPQDIVESPSEDGKRLFEVDLEIEGLTDAEMASVKEFVLELVAGRQAVVAAVGGQIFKRANFERKSTGLTALTVDEDGAVYGHVREYGSCYQYGGGQGDGGFCVEPPLTACDYEKFHVHGAKLDDGTILPVGAITYGDGHVSRGGLQASQAHYNDVATMAAKVVASEDEWGVWVCGEVLDSHRDMAYDILLSPMSGHWEPDADNGNHLEMLAAHIVVTPGYKVRRVVAGFGDGENADYLIVASPRASQKGTENGMVLTMTAAEHRKAEAIRKKLGVDAESRAAELRARINSVS